MECLWCGEPGENLTQETLLGADGVARVGGMHQACALRAVIGGVNHLRGVCTCCGGTEPPDPPQLTRYQAAWAAVHYWWAHRIVAGQDTQA